MKLKEPEAPGSNATVAPAERAPSEPKASVPPEGSASTPAPADRTREPACSRLVPPAATYSSRPPASWRPSPGEAASEAKVTLVPAASRSASAEAARRRMVPAATVRPPVKEERLPNVREVPEVTAAVLIPDNHKVLPLTAVTTAPAAIPVPVTVPPT